MRCSKRFGCYVKDVCDPAASSSGQCVTGAARGTNVPLLSLSRLAETNDQISGPEVGKSLDIKGKIFVISRPLPGDKRVYSVAITGFADLVSWRCDCGPIPRGSACRGRRRWKTSETNISRWGRFAWTLPLS